MGRLFFEISFSDHTNYQFQYQVFFGLPGRLSKNVSNNQWLWIMVGYQITTWEPPVILSITADYKFLKKLKWLIFSLLIFLY